MRKIFVTIQNILKDLLDKSRICPSTEQIQIFLIAAVLLGMAVMLTACSENTGTDASNDGADTQIENSADIRQDNEKEETVGVDTGNKVEKDKEMEEETEMKMKVQIGEYTFLATLENNSAVEELVEMMKEGAVTIDMNDYSGFEKVGSLGRSLTTSNSRTTTSAGDIVLYNGNSIVMFYGSNSWSYTRLGKIDDLSDWETALGSGSITAVFSLAE